MPQKVLWTEEQDILLRKMWAKGAHTGEIATALGRGRNAIIGRAHRINLPKHESTSRRELMNTPRKPKLAYIKPPTYPASIPVILPSSGVPFMEIKSEQCRAVIGRDDDGFKLVRFCGHPVKEGTSWCLGHAAKFNNPPRWR